MCQSGAVHDAGHDPGKLKWDLPVGISKLCDVPVTALEVHAGPRKEGMGAPCRPTPRGFPRDAWECVLDANPLIQPDRDSGELATDDGGVLAQGPAIRSGR